MSELLLDVRDLHTTFRTSDGDVPAVDGVSIYIEKGEVLALVGESGCGKSVTSLSIMRLIRSPGEVQAERMEFGGVDLLALPEDEMRKMRGSAMAMIFQEPMTSLNPVMTAGFQVAEPLEMHRGMSIPAAIQGAIELLKTARIPLPEQRVKEYPHQLSGGMRQRVMIAMALACRPRLLIADEPTTALDVTIQAQILALIRDLKEEMGMAVMLITHDMGVVREMADRVAVMYAGQIVEESQTRALFKEPLHPYTSGLLRSIPFVDEKVETLNVIRGVVPSPMFYPKGCRFNPRCEFRTTECVTQVPPLIPSQDGRSVRCWHPLGMKGDLSIGK